MNLAENIAWGPTTMENILIAIATTVIAVFTFLLFVLQSRQFEHDKKVAQANYKMNLFEKRIDIYFQIEEFFTSFLQKGEPMPEMASALMKQTRDAKFLFPESAQEYLEEIYKKSTHYRIFQNRNNALNVKIKVDARLTEEEQDKKDKNDDLMNEIERWFSEQIDSNVLEEKFSEHLKLPESL